MQKLLAFITSLFTALTPVSAPAPVPTPNPNVLGDTTAGLIFSVNIPARFKEPITAPNVVYSVNGESGEITVTEYEAGEGVSIEDGVISNTGILTLTAGDGISISGNKITSTITQGITSLTAGSGISISGSTITNTSTPDYTLSGWTDNGTSITLTTTTDTVTVGALTAGAVTVDSLTTDGLSLTSDLTVASGHSLLPEIDLGSDIGTSSKRFNNLWVANINSNSSQSFAGQSTFSYAPTDTTITEASVIINPTTSVANGQLLGLAIGGYQKALIDEDGDIILGYSDATSAPATDYPLNIYGHSGTRVSFVDTSGNGYFAGNVGIGTTNNAALLTLQNTGDYWTQFLNSSGSEKGSIRSTNQFSIAGRDSSGSTTLYLNSAASSYFTGGNVGIGTTSPQRTLDVSSTGNITFGDAVSTGSNERGIYWFSGNDYGIYRASGSWATLPKLNIAFNTGFNFSTGSPNTPKLTLSNTGGLSLGNSYAATDPGAGNMIISGNVGIGTTSPGAKLEVNTGSASTIGQIIKASASQTGNMLEIQNSSGQQMAYFTSSGGLRFINTLTNPIDTVSGGIFGGTTSSASGKGIASDPTGMSLFHWAGDIYLKPGNSDGTFTTALTAKPSGNVGIGTSNPSYKLQVTGGNAYLSGTGSSSGLMFNNHQIYQDTSTGNLNISNSNDFNVVFNLGAGNVGIGTSNPSYKLDVAGTFNTTGATTLGSTLDVSGLTTIAGTSGSNALQINRSGAEVLGILTGTNYANLNLVDSSTEPTNLLTNSTFNSDLTSWSEVPSYTLNDQFTTDLPAGSVNGTSAEPTGGTRTVVDTTGKLTIGSGTANFSPNAAWSNPGLYYPGISRVAGKFAVFDVYKTDTNSLLLGFGKGQGSYPIAGSIYFESGVGIGGRTYYNFSETVVPNMGSFSSGNTYKIALILKTNGLYYFIKGGSYTNWTLLYIESRGADATVYPAFTGLSATFTADNIRIPTSTWLPTPLAYDTFTRADGAIGNSETTGPDSQTTPSLAWTGGAISNNKLVITPTLGSELVVNGGFDADTNWTKGTGWAISGGTGNVVTGATWADLWQNQSLLVGGVYQKSVDYNIASGQIAGVTSSGNKITTFRATTTNGQAYVVFQNGAGVGSYVDNVSLKPLTLSSLFSSVSTSDTDVIADANVTLTAGTQAGLVTNLDSTSSPANFLIAYHDGTNVKLDKNVGGTYTNLISAAATYSAGATLRVITYHSNANTLKVRVYYNNALVGSEQTVSDAGIISNTKHGLFSTYSGNSFDNFSLFARGTGAEYTSAPFEELTATRDTSTYYAGGASAKLVADGTDANYLQSVNVGDTNTYNLIAYAYTDGSEVTSDDLSLYYDTDTITTTYTPIGGGGWYRLSGTLTGVASAKDYGVRVKAGKTVYVDEMKLQAGTASTQTMYVTNTGTGVTGLSVQGLINGTVNGVASFSKAGTISDSDFSGGVSDGLFGFDTTNHRLYFREGGSWSYIARTAGFQIPKEEVAGLSQGDYLMPYVEHFMSDGAVHGLYQKFDLNQVLAREGAVTFATAPIFPNNMAGTAVISTFSDHVDVDFTTPFISTPSVSINLTFPDSNHTYLESGLLATTTNVTPTGFSIILPTLAPRNFTYHWTAVAVNEMITTISKSIISTDSAILTSP